MKGRERAIALFEGSQTDRVGIFEQTISCSAASAVLGRFAPMGSSSLQYHESLAWLNGEEAHEEFLATLRQDVFDLARTLHFDMLRIPAWRIREKPTRLIDEYTIEYGSRDGAWRVRRYDPEAGQFGIVASSEPPLTSESLAESIRTRYAEFQRTGPRVSADEFAEHVSYQEEAGDEFEVVVNTGGLSIPMQCPYLELVALDPELIGLHLDMQVETTLVRLPILRDLGLRVLWGGGDLADNRGPIYGPRFFHEVVLPRYQRLVSAAHEHGLFYLFRSDGNLWSITDDLFLRAGIDGYGEVDAAAGMDFARLREAYPKLVLWGNVRCDVLLRGTPEDVRRETRYCIDAAGRTGPVFIGSSNSLLHGAPAENILALFETALEYGKLG